MNSPGTPENGVSPNRLDGDPSLSIRQQEYEESATILPVRRLYDSSDPQGCRLGIVAHRLRQVGRPRVADGVGLPLEPGGDLRDQPLPEILGGGGSEE